MAAPDPKPTTAMAEALERAVKRHHLSTALMFAGPLLILVGVAIAIRPAILIWVMALAFVGLGILMLAAAVFVRGMAYRMRGFAAELRQMRR